MAAYQGSSCRQGREGCKTPQACGMLVNGPPPVTRPSFVPRDAQITVESWPPLSRLTLIRVERWAVRCFWLVVAGCVGWALYANWPMLRWALQP